MVSVGCNHILCFNAEWQGQIGLANHKIFGVELWLAVQPTALSLKVLGYIPLHRVGGTAQLMAAGLFVGRTSRSTASSQSLVREVGRHEHFFANDAAYVFPCCDPC